MEREIPKELTKDVDKADKQTLEAKAKKKV